MKGSLIAILLVGLTKAVSVAAIPIQYTFTIDNPVFDWRVNGGYIDNEMIAALEQLSPDPNIHGSFIYDSGADAGGVSVTDFRGSAWTLSFELANAPVAQYRPDEVGGALHVQTVWNANGYSYTFNWASLNYLTLDNQSLNLLTTAPSSLDGATGSIDLFFNAWDGGSNASFHPLRVSGLVISEVPIPPTFMLYAGALLSLFARRKLNKPNRDSKR